MSSEATVRSPKAAPKRDGADGPRQPKTPSRRWALDQSAPELAAQGSGLRRRTTPLAATDHGYSPTSGPLPPRELPPPPRWGPRPGAQAQPRAQGPANSRYFRPSGPPRFPWDSQKDPPTHTRVTSRLPGHRGLTALGQAWVVLPHRARLAQVTTSAPRRNGAARIHRPLRLPGGRAAASASLLRKRPRLSRLRGHSDRPPADHPSGHAHVRVRRRPRQGRTLLRHALGNDNAEKRWSQHPTEVPATPSSSNRTCINLPPLTTLISRHSPRGHRRPLPPRQRHWPLWTLPPVPASELRPPSIRSHRSFNPHLLPGRAPPSVPRRVGVSLEGRGRARHPSSPQWMLRCSCRCGLRPDARQRESPREQHDAKLRRWSKLSFAP